MFLNEAGAPTVAFAEVDDPADIAEALQRLGQPLLLKSRRGGYDGKGQAWVGWRGRPTAPSPASAPAPPSSRPRPISAASCR